MDDCKKAMKSDDGEAAATTLFYSIDESYKKLLEETTRYTQMEGALEAEKNRWLLDLEQLPKELQNIQQE